MRSHASVIGRRHIGRLMLAALAIGASGHPLMAQATAFSGTWTSSLDNFHIVRNSRGWEAFLEAIAATRGYQIRIEQDRSVLTFSFPGGPDNRLASPPFVLDRREHSEVVSHGDRWEKFVTVGTQFGADMTLTTRVLTGLASEDPNSTTSHYAQRNIQLVLYLDSTGQMLTLRATLSDESGEAKYEQVFHRNP